MILYHVTWVITLDIIPCNMRITLDIITCNMGITLDIIPWNTGDNAGYYNM